VLERLWAAFVAACRDRAAADRSLTAAHRP
jgi:hypothetical protein